MSAYSRLETAIVVESRKGDAGTKALAELALDAWRRYGKGRHPAGLNLGDCVAYALACCTGEPLLYKGDDFSKTVVARAVFPD